MSSSIMPTYGPVELAFERGDGVYLFSADGGKYLDFGSGIAVTSVGHSNPHLLAKLHEQVDKVWHYSNLYRIPEQERLAERLCQNSFAATVFACNSGAEAVECGLKLVRRYQAENGSPEKYRVITCANGFHGRTLSEISAARNEKHMQGFGPLADGYDQVPFGNLNELRTAIGPETAAILVEPVQGEGGIFEADTGYMRDLRTAADEFGLLLFLDEVQTGIGRTGKLLACEWSGIQPDVVAVAKGLGGGFPVGACLANEKVSNSMAPGSHGSTFGGNPLAMAAANAVLDIILAEGFLDGVVAKGEYLQGELAKIVAKYPEKLAEVRGMGLLVGVECKVTNSDLVKSVENKFLLTVPAGNNVVRFIPPLTVSKAEIDEAVAIFDTACAEIAAP